MLDSDPYFDYLRKKKKKTTQSYAKQRLGATCHVFRYPDFSLALYVKALKLISALPHLYQNAPFKVSRNVAVCFSRNKMMQH